MLVREGWLAVLAAVQGVGAMMSLRYHVVSIAAILLALALGVVLGASALSGRVLGALTTDRDELAGQVVALRGRPRRRRHPPAGHRAARRRGAPSTVAGVLPGRGVAVVAAPGADPADVAAVSEPRRAAPADASPAGLALTDAALAPDRAEALRALVPRLLPAGRAAAHHHRHRRAHRLAARVAARRPARGTGRAGHADPRPGRRCTGAARRPGTCRRPSAPSTRRRPSSRSSSPAGGDRSAPRDSTAGPPDRRAGPRRAPARCSPGAPARAPSTAVARRLRPAQRPVHRRRRSRDRRRRSRPSSRCASRPTGGPALYGPAAGSFTPQPRAGPDGRRSARARAATRG